MLMNKKKLILMVLLLCVIGDANAADPILSIMRDIPSSLYVYKYVTLTLLGVFFCVATPFLSWYFKYKRVEQERYEKIYIILFKLCEILEKKTNVDDSSKLNELQSKFDDILEYINSNKKQDLLNKLIGRDQPTSLNKYRKFD